MSSFADWRTVAIVRCLQAAVTVAHRVAQEMGTEVGQAVGYAIRFEERTSRATRITYLTGR